MIHGIEEINLPSYATLDSATVTMQNMGDQTIEATLSIDRDKVPDFSFDWIIKFRGVEFIHPLRTPQASKSNEKFNPEYPLTFYHKGIYDLKRKFFFSIDPLNTDTATPDKYEASLSLNVNDFVAAYQRVLEYYYGDYITIDLNTKPTEDYDQEATTISISYTKMWDLLSAFYNNYKVSWWIEPHLTDNVPDGKYVIKVGYDRDKLSHQFEYGFKGGLLKMERQVQSSDIINVMLGRAGDKNLPYRYFKKRAEDSGGGGDEATFNPDPDWIPELDKIPFDGLRDINFRYWIQGWKDARYRYDSETGDISDSGDHLAGARRYAQDEHWAYDMGFTATKFDPVEYVKDVVSIAKYGEIEGGLQKVEDIYPSIQGVTIDGLGRVDQAVDVEKITTDDDTEEIEAPDTYEESVEGGYTVVDNPEKNTIHKIRFKSAYITAMVGESPGRGWEDITFTVKEGYQANIVYPKVGFKASLHTPRSVSDTTDVSSAISPVGDYTLHVYSVKDNTEYSPGALPAGEYWYSVEWEFMHALDRGWQDLSVGLVIDQLTVQAAVPVKRKWFGTFDIWVKNIWQSERLPGETDSQYAQRVWLPILGNHVGDTVKVVFSTGWLSFSEDYEFIITDIPAFDDTKILDGVPSHWRIPLGKIDSEYASTGLYLPNSMHNASPGDYFFFTGIDLPHWYVEQAEIRLNAYKLQQLDEVSEINPTWAIEFDRLRIGREQEGELAPLIDSLNVGADVTLFSKWFVSNPDWEERGGDTYDSTIQTLTFKFASQSGKASLIPSVTVTLADEPMTTASSVALIQGQVDALTSRINSMASPYVIDVIKTDDDITPETDYNVLSARRVTRNYLNSQGEDTAEGRITFNQGLTSGGLTKLKDKLQIGDVFMSGEYGFGGQIDADGRAELQSLSLREWLEVPELRYNRAAVLLGDQWNAPGAGIIESVEADTDASGNLLRTGTITLKLEDGEIGAVAVDDICKGYFHDFGSSAENATENATPEADSFGNSQYAGFCTVFFRITELLNDDGTAIDPQQGYSGRNLKFKYMLRETSAAQPSGQGWEQSHHPYQAMHFVCYGNFTNADRQRSAYSTRSYTRFIRGVNAWELSASNIAMQFGDLSNLSAFGLQMTGYSAYLQNIYMSGTIRDVVVDTAPEVRVESSTGDFFIYDGESITLTAEARRGWETLSPGAWAIARDSGDDSADAAWNAAHASFDGTITLAQSDIGATALNASALFTITATGDGWSASKTIAARTLRLPSVRSMRFVSEYGEYDTFIGYGDTVQFQAIVEDGLRNDYTAEYDQWKIERHNGDTPDDIASDGVWNATRAAISGSGAFQIEWSAAHDDLQAERATFIVTAQQGSASATRITGTLSI